jgi:uncharacterized membrane protein
MMTTEKQIKTAAAIGAVAGIRTFTAPAVIGRLARRGELQISCDYLRTIGNPITANVLVGLAASEIVADKLPMTPNRTDLGGLIPRIISGALCGAALRCAQKQPFATGALAGALGAVGGTFAAFHLRKLVTKSMGLPDLPVAMVEDAMAVGLSICVAKRAAQEKGAA